MLIRLYDSQFLKIHDNIYVSYTYIYINFFNISIVLRVVQYASLNVTEERIGTNYYKVIFIINNTSIVSISFCFYSEKS